MLGIKLSRNNRPEGFPLKGSHSDIRTTYAWVAQMQEIK